MNDLNPKRHDKFRAYRARKKAAGLREVRKWVPDVNSEAFKEASRRESEVLRNAPEEEETMQWVEAMIAADPDYFD